MYLHLCSSFCYGSWFLSGFGFGFVGWFKRLWVLLYCYAVHFFVCMEGTSITNWYKSICAVDFGFKAKFGWAMMWVINRWATWVRIDNDVGNLPLSQVILAQRWCGLVTPEPRGFRSVMMRVTYPWAPRVRLDDDEVTYPWALLVMLSIVRLTYPESDSIVIFCLYYLH